MNETVKQGC